VPSAFLDGYPVPNDKAMKKWARVHRGSPEARVVIEVTCPETLFSEEDSARHMSE
jgi:hypothetical protein